MPSSVGGPVPEASRQGRELQRYNQNGERLVAGCIPVRQVAKGAGSKSVEVLLISGRGGKGLVFPKGGWETDETVEAAAARETVEEAGVRGTIEEPLVGTYTFSSNKAVRVESVEQRKCVAYMFVMHVVEELATWPEQQHRSRVWCSIEEACKSCRHDWMREALREWIRKQGWEDEIMANGVSQSHAVVACSETELCLQ